MKRLWRFGITVGGWVTFFFIRRYTRARRREGVAVDLILEEIGVAYGEYKTNPTRAQ